MKWWIIHPRLVSLAGVQDTALFVHCVEQVREEGTVAPSIRVNEPFKFHAVSCLHEIRPPKCALPAGWSRVVVEMTGLRELFDH
jgi:hypothetical protein